MAVRAHGDQRYGELPYVVHLEAVALLCAPFGEDAEIVAYLHDTLEDTSLTKAEIESEFGVVVATCVEILTDPPGANRKARKAAAYARMAEVDARAPERLALIAKAADRLANVRASAKEANEGLLRMYRKEHPAFREAVLREGLNDELVRAIDELVA